MNISIKLMLVSVQPLHNRRLGQVRKIMDLLRLNTPDYLIRFGPVITYFCQRVFDNYLINGAKKAIDFGEKKRYCHCIAS